MENNKFLLLGVLVGLMLIVSLPVLARAEMAEEKSSNAPQGSENSMQADKVLDVKGEGNGNKDNAEQERNEGEETQIRNENENQEGIETEEKDADENQDQEENENNNEKGKNKGQSIAEQHRSAVANFVTSLEKVADEEIGIGKQVREIAKNQNEKKEKVTEQIRAVEQRGKVATFLFGVDSENLGQLRKEVTQTEKQIKELEKLAENAEGTESKTELQEQKQLLEQEKERIQNFIQEKENSFSLFGWVTKLFQ